MARLPVAVLPRRDGRVLSNRPSAKARNMMCSCVSFWPSGSFASGLRASRPRRACGLLSPPRWQTDRYSGKSMVPNPLGSVSLSAVPRQSTRPLRLPAESLSLQATSNPITLPLKLS